MLKVAFKRKPVSEDIEALAEIFARHDHERQVREADKLEEEMMAGEVKSKKQHRKGNQQNSENESRHILH